MCRRIWARSAAIVVLCVGCEDRDSGTTVIDASSVQTDSSETGSSETDGSETDGSEQGADDGGFVEAATTSTSGDPASSSLDDGTVSDGADAFITAPVDASYTTDVSSDIRSSDVGTSGGERSSSSSDATNASIDGSTDEMSTSSDAGCDGGACDASDKGVSCPDGAVATDGGCIAPSVCIALDDVLPAYLSTLSDASAPLTDSGLDAGDSGLRRSCGFPPCVAALLDACNPAGSCTFNNFHAQWANGVYMQLEHSPTVETLFRGDGAACLQAKQIDNNFTWSDGCGNPVATGVFVRDLALEVTCVDDGSVWLYDRGAEGCVEPSPPLSQTSYAYTGCTFG